MTQPRIGEPSDRPGRASLLTKRGLLVIAFVFFASHAPFVTTAPQEIDEANYVLGVRDFDVRVHQPHPPGNPVYVALGKLAAPVSRLWPPAPIEAGGQAAVEARALAFWSALIGALAVWPLFLTFRNLEHRDDVALVAAALTLAAPLYWFTAARPLSDVPGLVAALAAQGLFLAAWRQHQAGLVRAGARVDRADLYLVVGAGLAGLATGVRTQALWLTAPLFIGVLAMWKGTGRWRLVVLCAAAFSAAVIAWVVPMLWATGGLSAYLDALRWQVSDDVAGVGLLSRYQSLREIALALYQTGVGPWATPDAAWVILGLAGLGGALLAWRARPALAWLMLAFAPYAVLHFALHEISEMRYALPLIPPTAYLAARGLAALTRRWLPLASSLVIAGLLVITIPAFAQYVRQPSPVFAALGEVQRRLQADPTAVLVTHQPFRRALQLADLQGHVSMLETSPGREGEPLLDYWLDNGRQPVLFLYQPRRGMLALIDRASRSRARYRWSFRYESFLGGIRPGRIDLVELTSPPGWVCAEGWALTPDTGGVLYPDRREPNRRPAVAYVRRREEAAVVMIGGRHLAPKADPRPVTLTAMVDGRRVDSWTVQAEPDWFLQFIDLPPGRLDGDGPFATLTVEARAEGDPVPAIGLEQFDVQSVPALIWGFGQGWHEREFDLRTGQTWRWSSERARIIIRAATGDVTLRLAGESPLTYFDAAPHVTVRAGDEVLRRFTPSGDFVEDVAVPAAALERAAGSVIIETDRVFVPAESGASPDQRRLGLRLFEVSLR